MTEGILVIFGSGQLVVVSNNSNGSYLGNMKDVRCQDGKKLVGFSEMNQIKRKPETKRSALIGSDTMKKETPPGIYQTLQQ